MPANPSAVPPSRREVEELIREQIESHHSPAANYCWWCMRNVNGIDGPKESHADGCWYLRATAMLAALSAAGAPGEHMRSRLTSKLKAMQALDDGWSYGDGQPVTTAAVNVAEVFVDLASLLQIDADVFPNLDGGCAVAFYSGEDSVEVSVSPDGIELALRVEHGIGFQYEDVIEPAAVPEGFGHEKSQRIVDKAFTLGNWFKARGERPDEWMDLFSEIIVSDRPPTSADIARAQELAAKYGWEKEQPTAVPEPPPNTMIKKGMG